MQYLDYIDILCIKFLSKRLFKITFLNKRFKYFQYLAKQLTDCSVYYEKMKAFFNNFIQKVKSDIYLSNWLFLNYFNYNLQGDLLISSCFCHLFHCPRALFAKNDCYLCSKKFIESLITKPKSFNRLFDFTFQDRLTCVIITPCKIGRLFLEVFLRIFNAGYDFANNLSQSEQFVFLQKYLDCIIDYLPNTIGEFNYELFTKIFLENDYNSFHFKITNQNFINYCSAKYAC